jgi:hypothetical protein
MPTLVTAVTVLDLCLSALLSVKDFVRVERGSLSDDLIVATADGRRLKAICDAIDSFFD